jgi:hypothetical protein
VPRLRRSGFNCDLNPDLTVGATKCRPSGPLLLVITLAVQVLQSTRFEQPFFDSALERKITVALASSAYQIESAWVLLP